MEIKVEKYIYKKMSDIFIKRINFTQENIFKILEIFSLKNVVVEIGDVQKSDVLFEKIKRFNLKYKTSNENATPYFDIVLMASIEQIKELIDCILDTESEAFAITNVSDENQWEQYLYNKIPIRKLIKQGKVDINISVAIHESSIGISFSNEAYDAKQIASKIKKSF